RGKTPSVSTSGLNSGRFGGVEVWLGAVMQGGIVGRLVDPAAPHDADPGAGEDTHRVWMVLAGGAGAFVDVCGPGAFVTGIVSKRGDRHAQAFVTGPAERHGPMFTGRACDRHQSSERGDRFRIDVGVAGIAPFGQDLGSIDRAGARERCEN